LPEESGWELIDGYLVDKVTIGSKHAGTVMKIAKILERRFGDFFLIFSQSPLHIDDYNEPEPDVMMLRSRDDFYTESHPIAQDVLLLIEVADSSVEYDREVKRTLYAGAGIVELWLVNLQDNTVEVYSSPKNGTYRLARILEPGETVEAVAVENLRLAVEEILGV